MADDYRLSPTLTVEVPTFAGNSIAVDYGYFLGWGEDPDEGGWLEQWSAGVGLEVSVVLYCKWEDRINLVRALRGQVRATNNNGVAGLDRIAPSFTLNPPFADDNMAWDRFVCTGFGQFQRLATRVVQEEDDTPGDPGTIYSDLVMIPCNFEQVLYQTVDEIIDRGDPSGRGYTITTFEDAGQVIQPPAGAYQFKLAGAGPPELVQETRIGIYAPASEVTVERIFLPQLPMQDIQSLKGRVNADAITFLGVTFPPGSLLMQNVIQTDVYGDPGSGKLAWDAAYKMLAKMPSNAQPGGNNPPLSWNFIMNSKGEYTEIVDKAGNNPFASAPFASAIWPDNYL